MLFSGNKTAVEALSTWFAQEAAGALVQHKLEGGALLDWWPAFKRRVADKVQELNQQHLHAAQQRLDGMAAAGREVQEAMDAVGVGHGPVTADALKAVIEARRKYVGASTAVAAAERLRRRRCNIAAGERPTPQLSKLISRPAAARQIGALRTTVGGVAREGSRLAGMMAGYFAAVSASHALDEGAVQQVLQAVQRHASRMDAAASTAAGSASVTGHEVGVAVRHMRPGAAPGLDGLPAEVWRRGGQGARDLLAALFSAVGSEGRVPQGFLEGLISPIHKAGDATVMSNYRPICLLNTDYRIMTKVLATRLGPVLAAAVGSEQAAFLPGRTITSTITFLQLLPEALRLGGQAAAVVFLDMRKAYDTVSREFLFRVMEAVGAGTGLVRWARTILTDTTTAAMVNGYVSQQARYEEGVRQGCPLAPVLYLFAAWALACWLKDCPAVGVEVLPGRVVHLVQYADDVEVLLRDAQQGTVGQFLAHMQVFKGASGQALNPQKSLLLPMGAVDPAEQRPEAVAGIPVADRAKTLGLVFSNGRADIPEVDWDERLKPVRSRFSKIAALHLSAFGRAQCGGAYGLGGLHYHMQHAGASEDVLQQVGKMTVALVDRGLGPDSGERRLPGVPSDLLVGKPACGGFSLLPVRQHVAARHAVLARHFIVWAAGEPRVLLGKGARDARVAAPPRPDWVALAWHLLAAACPGAHPALCLLAATAVRGPGGRLPGQEVGRSLPEGPLQRMLQGLRALGPVEGVSDEPLQLGQAGQEAWRMPLWGNPLLQLEYGEGDRTMQWTMEGYEGILPARRALWQGEQAAGFQTWVGTPGLHTVGDLRRLVLRLTQVRHAWQGRYRQGQDCRAAWEAGGGWTQQVVKEVWGVASVYLPTWVRQLIMVWRPWVEDLQDLVQLWDAAQAMHAALPREWRRAADGSPVPPGAGLGVLDPGHRRRWWSRWWRGLVGATCCSQVSRRRQATLGLGTCRSGLPHGGSCCPSSQRRRQHGSSTLQMPMWRWEASGRQRTC